MPNQPLDAAVMLDADRVGTKRRSGGVAVKPIGVNKPLRVVIHRIYTGDWGGDNVLISSAVKSTLTYDAAPYALHGVRKGVRPNSYVEFTATDAGSPLVYYTPACLDGSLSVQVRLSYDRFDRDRYQRYVDLFTDAAKLPVFAAGTTLFGPAGGAGASAAILSVGTAVKVVLGILDRRIDGDDANDFIANHTLHFDTPDLPRAKAGWYLFRDDDERALLTVSPHGTWDADDPVTKEVSELFVVDVSDGTAVLRYRDSGLEVDDLEEPYVLAHVSGNEDEALAAYTQTAVSAALADRFLNVKGDTIDDIGQLMAAYNDLAMTKKIADLDAQIARSKDPKKKTALGAERAAVLKHIQDDEVRKLLPEAEG